MTRIQHFAGSKYHINLCPCTLALVTWLLLLIRADSASYRIWEGICPSCNCDNSNYSIINCSELQHLSFALQSLSTSPADSRLRGLIATHMCYSAHMTVRFFFTSLLTTAYSTWLNLCIEIALFSLYFTITLTLQWAKLFITSSTSFSQASCTCFLNKRIDCTHYQSSMWANPALCSIIACQHCGYSGTTQGHHSWHLNNLHFGRSYNLSPSFLCLRPTLLWQRSRTSVQQVFLDDWGRHGVLAGSRRFSLISKNKDYPKHTTDSFSVLAKDGHFPSIGMLRIV